MSLAAILSMPLAAAQAQNAPSWRSADDRPELLEAPPEVDAPEMSFEIDRESLFGRPAGFAPDAHASAPPVSEPALSEPVLLEEARPAPPAELVVGAPAAAPVPEPEAVPAKPVEEFVETPETVVLTPAEAEATLEAVEEVSQVDQTAVASINEAALVPEPVPDPVAREFRLERTRMVAPEYPRQAALVGQEGWVDLLVTVEPSGRVSDVDVQDAKPRRVFDNEARRAAMQWEFSPPAEAGISSPQQALFRLRFVLD